MLSTLFLILVIFLLVLAVFDLFVGVSNDAVNFLNSAIGCRIAPMKHILIVASFGVLIGSTFSSGMMEIARSGMFFPEKFSFEDVGFIYFSVMVTDVLMLHIFNHFGLPTSTTVSIIFELLGAAVMAALIRVIAAGSDYSVIIEYIKPDKTATIVSGILLSVAISFVAGALVQFFCRLLFSFHIERTYKLWGALYSGLCITSIFYFLVVKGAKNASFMKPEYMAYISDNTFTILISCFIGFTILSQMLMMFKFNIFKLIILSGTFALAFAFAGNDLVNFVGVPFAAMDGYAAYSVEGISPDSIMMNCLDGSARTPTILLLISGLIMVGTFYCSRSALKVIQTSINLSSSSKGSKEQFGSSVIGRVITRIGIEIARTVDSFLPKLVKKGIGSRYRIKVLAENECPVAFDYVRASVNLMVASVLIALATSLKLPLSTTYVTFMVAMGTSFADGAWDRESAVYRISGVVTVIAGWFLTAFCAFISSFTIAFAVFSMKWIAIFVLISAVAWVVLNKAFSQKKEEISENRLRSSANSAEIINVISNSAPHYYMKSTEILRKSLDAFFNDEENKLRKARNKSLKLIDKITDDRSSYFELALDEKSRSTQDAKHFFYLANTNMIEAARTMQQCISQAYNHISNRHSIFGSPLSNQLYTILMWIENIGEMLNEKNDDDKCVQEIIDMSMRINKMISDAQVGLVNVIAEKKIAISSSEIYLNMLQAMREITNRYIVVMLQKRAIEKYNEMGDEKSEEEILSSQMVVPGFSPRSLMRQKLF